MAAKPKLSPEQWAAARQRWEADSREGYTWLVDELALPVSAPAVRKTAVRDGWAKGAAAPAAGRVGQQGGKVAGKAGRAASTGKQERKASNANGRGMVSKVSETIETMPQTFPTRETIETLRPPSLEEDPDQFGLLPDLNDAEEIFVREYMVDWNGTRAAIRAGYSPKSASQAAWSLLRKPRVMDAIATLGSARARRLGIDADEVMRLWVEIITLDANELSQLRRVCCPFCYGTDHQRQYTPSGLEKAKTMHDRERARRMKADASDDIGEFPPYLDDWYDKRNAPAEDCPECHGEGVEEVYFADTRTLSPAARLVYSGVKVGRDGIEVLAMSKERALDNFARALGMFKDREADPAVAMVSTDDLLRVFEEKMAASRERQRKVLLERGLIEAEDVDCSASSNGAGGDDAVAEGEGL